jgi:hypothetical protein
VVFNATFNNISVISWQSVVFNATFNNISVISWRSVLFKRELKRWNNGNSNVSPLKQNGLKQEKYIQTYIWLLFLNVTLKSYRNNEETSQPATGLQNVRVILVKHNVNTKHIKLINWCLTSILAIFLLYREMNKFY